MSQGGGEKLRTVAVGLRLSFTKFGVTRAVRGEVKEHIAASAQAESGSLAVQRKILNTKNEHYAAVGKILSRAERYWKDHTIPYLEPGVRLTTKDKYPAVKAAVEGFAQELAAAEQNLEAHREELIQESKERQGPRLFNPSDFPETFLGSHGIGLEPFNLEIPDYLKEIDPAEYQAQVQKLNARMDASLARHEADLAESFADMMGRLAEALRPAEDGSKKRLGSGTLEKIQEFFARYKEVRAQLAGVKDSDAIEGVVARAEEVLGGFDADGIRASQKVRDQLGAALAEVTEELARKVVTAPRRKVGRKAEESETQQPANQVA